jgi:predicted PP-loop superfamily ATPase
MSDKFLEDPNNNIWSWAERNIEVEKKPAPTLIDTIKERAKAWHERAKKEHISDADLLVAFFEGGIDPSAVVQALDKLGYDLDVKVEPEAPLADALM